MTIYESMAAFSSSVFTTPLQQLRMLAIMSQSDIIQAAWARTVKLAVAELTCSKKFASTGTRDAHSDAVAFNVCASQLLAALLGVRTSAAVRLPTIPGHFLRMEHELQH